MADNASEISRLEQANGLGLAFLRTMVTLNGGAILALLTFVGNSNSQSAFTVDLISIKMAMGSFLVAIGAMLLALLASYTYTALAPEVKIRAYLDTKIIGLNAILGIVSLASFCFGVVKVLSGTAGT